jgi:hypothetical protein
MKKFMYWAFNRIIFLTSISLESISSFNESISSSLFILRGWFIGENLSIHDGCTEQSVSEKYNLFPENKKIQAKVSENLNKE